MADLYEEIVDAMNELSGVHPGYRAAHAKGILCTGEFTATPEASGLSRAPHLAGDPVSALVRFSNGGGDPHVHPSVASADRERMSVALPGVCDGPGDGQRQCPSGSRQIRASVAALNAAVPDVRVSRDAPCR